MKETAFLGTLMPAHPDLIPIVEAMRKKYNLPEISPDDDPITEIYLGDEIIPLKDFRKEIEMEGVRLEQPATASLRAYRFRS